VPKFFAAVPTAAIQKMCEVLLMSPIFRCLGCGQYIERSLATYKKYKGKIFCSTCNDRKQVESAADSKKT
jgi:transcription elongation factor Elf1